MTNYRYAMFFTGASYGAFDVENPEHAVMVESVAEAIDALRWMAGNGNAYKMTGAGVETLDTPGFGEPGDYAYLFPVAATHANGHQLADADAARVAYEGAIEQMTAHDGILQDLNPSHILTFGPRGGVQVRQHGYC